MEIEVGEYCRSKYGEIGIITNIYPQIMWRKKKNPSLLDYNLIKSHSKNIIDLIEVGDIVELKEDIDMFAKSEKIGVSDTTMLNTIKESILERKIKLISILTHEQYEQNSFKL